MPPQDPIDIIATQILFDAKSALANLKKFNEEIGDSAKKVAGLKSIISRVSQEIGGDLKTATASVQKFANAFTGINPQLVKGIGKELKLLDDIAKKSLGDMSGKTLESSTRMTLLSNAIQQMAVKGKVSIGQVVQSLQMLNASTGKAYQFGKLGFSQDDIVKAGQAATQSQAQLQTQLDRTGRAGEQAGKKTESAFSKVISTVNVIRIALGALVSMILFQAIQAVSTFATESIRQFTELEETLFRIRNVEQELSEAGIEISVSGLKKGIRELREELKIFSEEEIAKLVGKVAISTKDLKYSEEQILALAKSIAILNLRSTEVEDLSQTSSKVITSLLSGTTKGVSGLGLQLNDATIKAKALEMGLLAAGEEVSDLSKKEKDLVKLEIILASAALESENFSEFLETNSAKIKENAATWEDLQVAFGGLTSTLTPALTEVIGMMIDVVNGFKALLPIWDTFQVTVDAVKQTLVSTLDPMERARRLAELFKNIPEAFRAIAKESIPRLFAEMPEDAPQWFKDLYGEFLVDTETATAEVEELVGIEDDTTAETLEEIDDKLRDIAIDAQHAREDLAIALSQKQEDIEVKFTEKRTDIDTEYERKEEDAARDLQRKISDIERDAERERQRVLDKARDEERKAEEDHQLKLWELKMRYLMDLEDALHARDARQIIRLQRQYQLDKELLEKKKQQEDEERQRSIEADLEEVELRKKERLEDAQIEYQEKLADLAAAKARELEELNVWKAREEADLKVWYQRELEDIDRQTRQKIERLLAGYIEEGKIHEEQQEAIHQILLKYFGENKQLVDDLIAYTAQAFSGMSTLAQNAFVQAGSLLAQMGQQVGSIATNPFTSSFQGGGILTYEQMVQNQIGGGKKYAEGGSVIATRPTTAVFGDRGAELATFTPLDRKGRDVNKLFGAGDISKGEGRIALDILLSPDLRANIIEDSMDGVADVIARVNRSKV